MTPPGRVPGFVPALLNYALAVSVRNVMRGMMLGNKSARVIPLVRYS